METRVNPLAASPEKVNCRAFRPANKVKTPVIKAIKRLCRIPLDTAAPKSLKCD
jgi:hypothetical protein